MTLNSVRFCLKLSLCSNILGLFFNTVSVSNVWLTVKDFNALTTNDQAAYCFTYISVIFGIAAAFAGAFSNVYDIGCLGLGEGNVSRLQSNDFTLVIFAFMTCSPSPSFFQDSTAF